jgi:hypothetical protein
VQHVTGDSLERYAMQTLSESEVGSLEDHLLICPDCRERLQPEIEFVAAMREGGGEHPGSREVVMEIVAHRVVRSRK